MTTFEILILALAGVAAVAAIIGAILAGRKKTDDLTPQIVQLTTRVAEQQKNTSDEFARNRMELSKQLEVMQGKLAEMTKANFEQRITLNETVTKSLNDIRDRTVQENERLVKVVEAAIGKMQESNEKKLDEMRATVDEKLTSTLTTRLNSSFKTVSEQLENLYKSLGEMKELSAGVTDNVTALNRVLTNVKARGTWAEIQLKGILDQIIPGRYVENYSPKGTGSVEFAVIIPASNGKQTYLPLDSKFPMEDYIRITEAADAGDAAALKEARKALEARITQEAKDISTKYISVPDTTPFAILYLATEGLYAEAVSAGGGLMEKIHSTYGVLIAGPSTITALLNSLAMGFRTIAVNEKAEEIRVMLTAIKAQYEKFGVLLEKARKKVDEAGRTLEDAQKRNNQIQRKLKNVETMEAGAAENLLFDDALPALPETE